MTARDYDQVMWAEKRWGHGRLKQLAHRWLCQRRGHQVSAWRRDPEGAWTRRCIHGCGLVQVTLHRR